MFQSGYNQPESYLNLSVDFDEANLAPGTVVRLVGDRKVGKVTSSAHIAVGEVLKTTAFAGPSVFEPGTIRTQFRRIADDAIAAETLVAGDIVVVVSSSGTGAAVVQKWGKPTGSIDRRQYYGVVLTGGAADAAVEIGIL